MNEKIGTKERKAILTEAALRRLLEAANVRGLFLAPVGLDGGRWHILDSKGEKIFPRGSGSVGMTGAAEYLV